MINLLKSDKMENIAFTNPEYMSFDELVKLTSTFQQTSNNKLGPPPSKPPQPPPKTPPIIRHPKPKHLKPPTFLPPPPPVPLYQNVNVSPTSTSTILSDISSSNSSSSNATMIIRKSPLASFTTNSIFEEEQDEVCSIIINDVKSSNISPPPLAPVFKLNTPRIINRLSLLNESNNNNNNNNTINRRRSEPGSNSKRMTSLSPIMTSSRADLNSLVNNQQKNKNSLFEVFSEIEEEINSLEPTIIDSPPLLTNYNFNSLPTRSRTKFETNSLPRNLLQNSETKSNCFNNCNYYYVTNLESNSNSSVDEHLSLDDNSIDSSLCSIVLQPPSPFKSPKQASSILARKTSTNAAKKVSFMINENVDNRSSISSSSSCSSISSAGSCDQVQELDLIKEKIFSKIFSNQDYFVSDLINKIESASASSIPSSCASSTSSSSSGYKSQHSSRIQAPQVPQVTKEASSNKIPRNQSTVELSEFIESNRYRLDRLKTKRNNLIGL